MKEQEEQNMYELGAVHAQEVQEGLKLGMSFDELHAWTPERAEQVRDAAQNVGSQDSYNFLRGYLSHWD